MALTKAQLVNQSDQVLSSPTVENSIVLRTLSTDPAINLTFSPAPASDRTINFPDPGIPTDFVIYGNAVQTLSNKSLVGVTLSGAPTITDFTNAQHTHANPAQGGQFAHANLLLRNADDHLQYALLAGRTGGQTLIGGNGASDPLTLRSTTNVTKGGILVDQDDITMGSGHVIVFSGGGEPQGLPASPGGPTSATSKTYVDTQIAILTGGAGVWKEDLLSALQLDNTHDAIAQAVAFFWNALPIVGDTFRLTDGVNSETYTYAGVSSPFNPVPGVSATTAMNNLAANITANSGFWSATVVSTLQSLNGSGFVMVVTRKIPTGVVADRIFGVTATPNIGRYVNFGGQPDYRSRVVVNLPTVDPGSPTFGISRLTAALIPDEAHVVRAEDSVYLWNDDAGIWQLSGGATTLATSANNGVIGGAVAGSAAFDELKGLHTLVDGTTRVKVDGTSIDFNGSGQLEIIGGAIPLATSANNGVSGGAVAGRAAFDELKGLHTLGDGSTQVKVDGTSMVFDLSGNLHATPAAASPTGLISDNVPFTNDIPAVAPPTPGNLATDIPTLDFPHGSTTGQLFDLTIPDDYDSGDLEIAAVYQMGSAQAANVRLQTQAKIVHIAGSIDTVTFPATPSTLTPPNDAAPHRAVVFNITAGTFSKGDVIQVYISRLGGNVADTHLASWRVVSFEYLYTGQVQTRVATQLIEAFSDVVGQNTIVAGTISTDIPTVDFVSFQNSAQKILFIVPDNWDGSSDGEIKLDYVMSSAVGGTVRLTFGGAQVDIVNNLVNTLTTQNFDIAVPTDTNPHRSVVLHSLPGVSLHPGDYFEISILRDISVGGNSAANFKVLNATVTFGVAPTQVTISQTTEMYIEPGTFGNLVGPATVSGNTTYPNFATSFETLYQLSSTSVGTGEIDVAFEGRLASFQTKLDNIRISHIQLSGTPTLTIKVYFEGQGAIPVYTNTVTLSGTLTELLIDTHLFTQPTGSRRYFVVAEGHFTAVSSVAVSQPFVRME